MPYLIFGGTVSSLPINSSAGIVPVAFVSSFLHSFCTSCQFLYTKVFSFPSAVSGAVCGVAALEIPRILLIESDVPYNPFNNNLDQVSCNNVNRLYKSDELTQILLSQVSSTPSQFPSTVPVCWATLAKHCAPQRQMQPIVVSALRSVLISQSIN